jgi:DNA-binding transcriptional LysR family regulator
MRSNHRLIEKSAISPKDLRGEAFVVYAAHAADEGPVRLLRQVLGEEPRVLHHVQNTLTVLTLAAAGVGLALVPGSLQTVNIPNITYRRLINCSLQSDLVLVSRRNESSPATRRFIEIARANPPGQKRSIALEVSRRRSSSR